MIMMRHDWELWWTQLCISSTQMHNFGKERGGGGNKAKHCKRVGQDGYMSGRGSDDRRDLGEAE